MKCISSGIWCKGDGVPETSEEFDIRNDLLTYGKKSRYCDPESYWLYKSDVDATKKAA